MFVDSIPNYPVQAKIQPQSRFPKQLTFCFALRSCCVSWPSFWFVEVLDMNDIKRALSFQEKLGEDDVVELQDEAVVLLKLIVATRTEWK